MAVALIIREGAGSEIAIGICLSLAAIGLLVMFAIYDAHASYRRTAKLMREVESKLGLGEHTSGSYRHALPHYLICLGTIGMVLFCAKTIN